MSASPQRFDFVPHTPAPEVYSPRESPARDAELLALVERAVQTSNRSRLYATLGMVATFAAGVLSGYFVYLLWEQVGSQDKQMTQQGSAIQRLAANEAAVTGQVERLGTIDSKVEALRAELDSQSRRLSDVQRSQSGMRDQMSGLSARWQRELHALAKAKPAAPAAAVAGPETEKAAPQAPPAVASPAPQQSLEKHNETFSSDLKPTANAYAQMSASGLVVWMTPRPGSAKPVPTSVIGHVRGLGMLVHDWDDNNHYFITESGSWILDQR
jgi:hypothetical protein